jgi:HK97 family phage major capsid protein/HK97 family phage prohead protease
MAKKAEEQKLLYREAIIDAAGIAADSNECNMSFSSEQPVERYDWMDGKSYMEILSHDSKSVDLSRLNNKHPLLVNHDTRDQVGVVTKAEIGPDKKGRATVRFSKSVRGKEILQDVKDGIRGLVSVGYQVGKELTKSNRDGMEYRTFEWTPYELSLVPIPADTTVGVGRNQPAEKPIENIKFMPEAIIAPPPPAEKPPVAAPAIVRSAEDITRDERKRMADIIAIGRKFKKDDDAQKALGDGTSVSDFRALVMEGLKSGSEEKSADQTVARSVGESFVLSDAYKKFTKASGKRSMSFDVPIDYRTTGVTTGLTSIEKMPGIITIGVQPPHVADIIPNTATNATTIRYIRENSLTLAAAAVAENGQKPEAAWDLVEVDAAVKKIAVIGRVSDEFFQDYEATRDYINNRLAYMVKIQEDNQLLNATGAANTIVGILATAGIQTEAEGADTAPDAVMKAMTKIRTIGFFEPDGIIMNPTDLQNLRLMKDKNGQYYFNGPFQGSYGNPLGPQTPMVWGLPIIWTTQIAVGTALVGAFGLGAQIFRKLGLTIETSNSDASDFQYNRIAIRAEERLTLAVYRPLAFCTVTGLS